MGPRPAMIAPMTSFGPHLRQWRTTRRLSQLDLALEANVSARHISFLETGRAAPSRQMVRHLSEILSVPPARRNDLLEAAGFRAAYERLPLDDAALAPVQTALQRIMHRHAPYPAIMKDLSWRIVDMNTPAAQLFGAAGLGLGDSLLDFITTPGQAAAVIENWGEVGHHTLHRIRAESRAAGGIAVLDEAVAALARDPAVAGFEPSHPLPPIVSTIFRLGDLRLPLFSTFAQLGGAEELGLAELAIELMFPATAEAEACFAATEARTAEA